MLFFRLKIEEIELVKQPLRLTAMLSSFASPLVSSQYVCFTLTCGKRDAPLMEALSISFKNYDAWRGYTLRGQHSLLTGQ